MYNKNKNKITTLKTLLMLSITSMMLIPGGIIPVHATSGDVSSIIETNSSITNKLVVYTAVQSGDWNDSATWGGVGPSTMINVDDTVVIPNGISVTTYGQVISIKNGTIINQGTLNNTAGVINNSGGTIDNYGIMFVDRGNIDNYGAYQPDMASDLNPGILNNYGTITVNLGTIQNSGGTTNNFGTINLDSGEFDNSARSIDIFSESVDIPGGILNNSGILNLNDGGVYPDGSVSTANSSIRNSGSFISIGGIINNNSGGIVNNNNGAIDNSDGGTIHNFSGGSIHNNNIIIYNFDGIINNYCGAIYTGNPPDGNPVNFFQCTPIIASLIADDPDDRDDVYSRGDTITIIFNSDTNMPGGTDQQIRSAVDDLFTFTESLGRQYNGQWSTPDTFTITIRNASNAGSPIINGTTVTPAGITPILSSDETSEPSIAVSPVLSGDFGIISSPAITTLVADDPDNLDDVYSVGDTITITFDSDTNTPGGARMQTRAAVDDLFTFTDSLGRAYSGEWSTPDTFTITINGANGAGPPIINGTTVTPAGITPILSSDETSEPSIAVSPVLSGDFGIIP